MEKLVLAPLGIRNEPNFSGFVVLCKVPLAGGCFRRLSLISVCLTNCSFEMSSLVKIILNSVFVPKNNVNFLTNPKRSENNNN